jgi:DNA-binding NtrC family response regulator
MSGMEFLRQVKSLHPQTACIMLSGCGAADSVTEATHEEAAFKFFIHPWDDQQLRTQIAEAFRRQEPATSAHGA